MKKHKILGIIVITTALISVSANAQSVRNIKEAADNQKEIKIGKEQLEKDIAQLDSFKEKISGFQIALDNEQIEKARTFKVAILNDMRREVEQSEWKIAQDKREVARSKNEANASRREAGRSNVRARSGDRSYARAKFARDDQRDKRDDQRDVKDDQYDLKVQIARTARQKEILIALETYSILNDAPGSEKVIVSKRLLDEFIGTMEADIAATKIELKEDKRERREDSRERREDRRSRNY